MSTSRNRARALDRDAARARAPRGPRPHPRPRPRFALVDALVGALDSCPRRRRCDHDGALTGVRDLADVLDRARAHALADTSSAPAPTPATSPELPASTTSPHLARDLAVISTRHAAPRPRADLDLDRADARANGREQPGPGGLPPQRLACLPPPPGCCPLPIAAGMRRSTGLSCGILPKPGRPHQAVAVCLLPAPQRAPDERHAAISAPQELGTVKSTLKHAGRAAGGTFSLAALTQLSMPALAAVVVLAVLVLGVICWIISSDDRSARVSRMMLARRGTPSAWRRAPLPRLRLRPGRAVRALPRGATPGLGRVSRRPLPGRRPSLNFHLLTVPVDHIDQRAHDDVLRQPRREVHVIDQGGQPVSRGLRHVPGPHGRIRGHRLPARLRRLCPSRTISLSRPISPGCWQGGRRIWRLYE